MHQRVLASEIQCTWAYWVMKRVLCKQEAQQCWCFNASGSSVWSCVWSFSGSLMDFFLILQWGACRRTDYSRCNRVCVRVHPCFAPSFWDSFLIHCDYEQNKVPTEYGYELMKERNCDECNVIQWFSIFLCVWFEHRILNTTLFESWEIVGPYPSWWVFNGLLVLLQGLHMFWSYLIVKIACKAISKGKVREVSLHTLTSLIIRSTCSNYICSHCI